MELGIEAQEEKREENNKIEPNIRKKKTKTVKPFQVESTVLVQHIWEYVIYIAQK